MARADSDGLTDLARSRGAGAVLAVLYVGVVTPVGLARRAARLRDGSRWRAAELPSYFHWTGSERRPR